MLKRRLLAAVGFSLGTALVLISSPLTLFTAPETFKHPIEPTPQATTESKPSPTPTESAPSQVTVAPSPVATATKTTATTTTAPSTSQTSKTLTGNIEAAGKYGNVQVQIVIMDGAITSAKALLYPDGDSRSSSISALAVPILIEQTIDARDNANVQGVSQASYTSEAWRKSLQSALAKQ